MYFAKKIRNLSKTKLRSQSTSDIFKGTMFGAVIGLLLHTVSAATRPATTIYMQWEPSGATRSTWIRNTPIHAGQLEVNVEKLFSDSLKQHLPSHEFQTLKPEIKEVIEAQKARAVSQFLEVIQDLTACAKYSKDVQGTTVTCRDKAATQLSNTLFHAFKSDPETIKGLKIGGFFVDANVSSLEALPRFKLSGNPILSQLGISSLDCQMRERPSSTVLRGKTKCILQLTKALPPLAAVSPKKSTRLQ